MLWDPPEAFIERVETWFLRGILAVIAVYTLIQAGVHKSALLRWDWMFITGAATLWIGLNLIRNMPRELHRILQRLEDRGLVRTPDTNPEEIGERIERRGRRWSHLTGLACTLVVLLAFSVSFSLQYRYTAIVSPLPGHSILSLGWAVFSIAGLSVIGGVGGYLAGRHFGRFFLNGFLARELEEVRVELDPFPGHPDEAAGLKPLGEFYYHQALLVAVPAPFLAGWWFVLPAWSGYSQWAPTFFILLSCVFLAELAAFVFPLWIFHLRLREKRHELLRGTDDLTRRIRSISRELEGDLPPEEREMKMAHLAHLEKGIQEIASMPTWPLSPQTRHRFAKVNSAYLVPFAAQLGRSFGLPVNLVDVLSLVQWI